MNLTPAADVAVTALDDVQVHDLLPWSSPSELDERVGNSLDVVLMVVEVHRETQVSVAGGAHDPSRLECWDQISGSVAAEWH
jgi:hypothetical protein